MKSKVALVKARPQAMQYSTLESVREAIDLLGGVGSFVKPGQKVLVKPNIAMPKPMDYTSPVVTWAIVKVFADYGCHVYLGEDSAIPTSEKSAYEEYGMREIAEDAGAELVSFRKSEHVTLQVPESGYFSEISVSKYAAEVDLIVSAAAMKSANITTVTLGMKNMKGVITTPWKRKFHTEGLNQGVVDLNSVVKPGLVIIDGSLGRDMTRKLCYPVSLIIAGADPVATDSTCSRIMGFDPEEVEHIKLASERGLGKIKREDIEVLGLDFDNVIGELKTQFTFSQPKNPFYYQDESEGKLRIVQGNPCSICLNELGNTLDLVRGRLKDLPKTTIFIGPNANPDDHPDSGHAILYGNCLRPRKEGNIFLEGCPPTEDAWIAEHNGSLMEIL